ncbi:YncE family protein [Pseudomarimonas salicorniae]|uniref:Cytochrome c domain-containing protein n=1 Tax=Pseudomarimonas salicorniae TaxID=2933270 RepID=A0ABT0GJM8_9GAMM|nr:hypothetical protein [Lysobacter sp. CAU 1642]MCK7594237.1 hypothetical protein [Lysobacter sp. CAU 1642]
MSRPLGLALTGLLLATPLQAIAQAELPHINYENHPQRALDISPDGRWLAVAHTADARVQLFRLTRHGPVAAGHVKVGLDPVAVRFRGNDELWVANHISDSISIIEPSSRRLLRTLQTGDEPFDIAFAGGRAFVSCSQVNEVWVFTADDPDAPPRVLPIDAEDPRALSVSRDGGTVAVAIFESGNGSTALGGGLDGDMILAVPNVVSDARGPYGGINPPPNDGAVFDPPLDPSATPPRVGLIVRQDGQGKWRDDNGADWSPLVDGELADASGRRAGWSLPDRDLALIDVDQLTISYVSGLMNAGMALATQPQSGEFTLVGTDARNQIRFEPKLNGRFLEVKLARVNADAGPRSITDLNPHVDYARPRLPADQRGLSLGDPRGIAWSADGQRGWISGMGSNNVVPIRADGSRSGPPIEVGEGPTGIIHDAVHDRVYVWNHFEASLSVIDPGAGAELQRIDVFNPLPAAIREGRPFLYDTRRTSGQGQVSCASCHIDARMDRLAWDLGDPSQPPAAFDQNCVTDRGTACEDFHAMKGPMTTQTLQDIIGHEPHHWRGDRAGIEAFNPAFEGLLGDDGLLSAADMQRFEDFLATITYPPNPFRGLRNQLPTSLPLPGHFSSGRFTTAGQPLPPGNAERGLQLFTMGFLDPPFQCANCHTLPTGMAANGPMFALGGILAGGSVMATGPHGENHLGIVSTDGSTNVSIKVPQLRNQYEKVGFELTQAESRAGFGFLHDGSIDSLSRFFSASVFTTRGEQDIADLVALTLAFSGSEFSLPNPALGAPAPLSKDSHAAVGRQVEWSGGPPEGDVATLLNETRLGRIGLVALRAGLHFAYDSASGRWRPDNGGETLDTEQLTTGASAAQPLRLTALPTGLAERLGIDRDGDGIADAAELAQGSNPADAESRALRGVAGLWFNPDREGHGFDLEHIGSLSAVTWYTYEEDGTPVWYQGVGERGNPTRIPLFRYRRGSDGTASGTEVGELVLRYESASRLQFDWRLGERSGSEPMQPLLRGETAPAPDRTGIYFDPSEPGWGLSITTEGDVRGALLYYYASNGEPRWALGLGDNRVDAEQVALLGFRGFCPACPAGPVTSSALGSLDWRFDGGREFLLHTDIGGNDPWQRSAAQLAPLSDPAFDPRWR